MLFNHYKIFQVDKLIIRQKGKVLIVEVMGRHAGWLTAARRALPERI